MSLPKAFRSSLAEPTAGVDPALLFDTECLAAANRYVSAAQALKDRMYWPVKMHAAVNLFLWHLDAFAGNDDPRPQFVKTMDRAVAVLDAARHSGLASGDFPIIGNAPDANFEGAVSGLFSDIWVGLTDDIYFDQSYAFTKERLDKNGVDPITLFGGKVVLDAGCGSGKFSAAIARFGAAQVIGLDLGEKGLDFARNQAKKVSYGNRLDFRHGSLLEIPLGDGTVDMVWSNGVIHHTADYEQCVREFHRVLKPGGTLFLYVNGRFGLFELLVDSIRLSMCDVPRSLYIHFLMNLGCNSGRVYWITDHTYAPYEWKARADVVSMLERNGFRDIRQLTRGVATDQIEQISCGLPYAEIKYGEGQLKFLAQRD